MQETFCYFIGIAAVLWVTLLVAFPDHLVPDSANKRKRKFNGRHWGGYKDSPAMNAEKCADDTETVEVGTPAAKLRYIVGSSTYAGR